jgi:hypothetical protein
MHNGLVHEFAKVKRDLLLAIDARLFPESSYGVIKPGDDELHPFQPIAP